MDPRDMFGLLGLFLGGTRWSRVVVLVLAIVAAFPHATGCAVESGRGTDARGCALLPASQQLVEQIVDSVEVQLESALLASPTEVGIRWTYLGTDNEAGTDAFLVAGCTAPRVDAESCRSQRGTPPTVGNTDLCFRLGCEGPDVAFVDVYLTEPPHHLVDDRVSISYETTPPFSAGTVAFDPNPLIRWTTDFREAGALAVFAMPEQHGSLALADGGIVDFSFTGNAVGTSVADGDTWTGDITLSFPELSETGAVEVVTHNSSDALRSGEVTVGEETLGLVTQDGVVWQEPCTL